jgi:hypothetical protein
MEPDSDEDMDDASAGSNASSNRSETDRLDPVFEKQEDDLFLVRCFVFYQFSYL